VINTYKPFKTTGSNEIAPALLQQEVDLCRFISAIFTVCLARGYIPKAWRQVKVMFIPKPRKVNYTKARAYCPISLSSFVLKRMKKLVDRHINGEILWLHPLHQ
jgi:hypothetical protein